ncbi:MAG TPA: hypothetical protein GX723_07460 [Thermoanaerobacterales bacterium]|nr:hypothetical protein [Thermoanaerobacterales bacterium]
MRIDIEGRLPRLNEMIDAAKDNGNPFIQPGQYTDEELSIAELIQRRRLQMLIHSKLYYDMDTSLVTDKQFDEWGRELVQLQKDNPEIAKRICFAEAFKDWDASTGAFLPLQDPWVIRKAQQLLNINRNMKGENYKHEYEKIQQEPRIKSSEKPKRKKATKQRGNSLF